MGADAVGYATQIGNRVKAAQLTTGDETVDDSGAFGPGIAAGDPASPRGQEPATAPGVVSANVRIDRGVYGGTAQATLAP